MKEYEVIRYDIISYYFLSLVHRSNREPKTKKKMATRFLKASKTQKWRSIYDIQKPKMPLLIGSNGINNRDDETVTQLAIYIIFCGQAEGLQIIRKAYLQSQKYNDDRKLEDCAG